MISRPHNLQEKPMNHFPGGGPAEIISEPFGQVSRMKAFAHRSRIILLFMAPLPELALATGFGLIAGILANAFGLRFVLPAGNALQFTGMSYWVPRSEEHTSELQSLMRISYAVFCLKKKKQ